MAKSLKPTERDWYFNAIDALGGGAATSDRTNNTVTYNSAIPSDESHVKSADPEELAHAVIVALLASKDYRYPLHSICHEMHYAHGSYGSKSDEVDIVLLDEDQLPYAIFEIKASTEYASEKDEAIKSQLFGTAPLVGSPKLLVYATVEPKGPSAKLRAICIDYTKHKSYEAWRDEGEPHSNQFPKDYRDLDYSPYINQGPNDLAMDSSQADFRAVALAFHNEFFGEHADNTIFVNLVRCLLAKIHDERTRKKSEAYDFQSSTRTVSPS